MSPAEDSTRRRRLNPFAFPSDTVFRFALLIVSVLGVSLFLYNWLYFSFADNGTIIRKTQACIVANDSALSTANGIDELRAANAAFSQCNAAINRPKGTFMLGGIALLLVVTLLLYLVVPRWRLWRGRFVPFTAEDDPDIATALEELSAEIGLRHPPRFVWNPLNPVPSGLAFGRAGRRYVALSGGLVTRYYTDRAGFRGVVLHELSHLRNRDVDQTYITVVLWYAFLLAALVPFIPTLFDETGNTIWQLGWRIAALTALVYLTRNAVLRSREVYADVRASISEPVGLRRVLASLAARPRLRDRVLGLHPDPARRLAAVDDTDRLFSISLVAVAGTGIAATIAYQEVVSLVGFYDQESMSTMWWSALAFAPLAAAVVAFGLWRSAFASLSGGRRATQPFAVGAALGIGFLVGQELSLSSVIGHEDVILGTAWQNLVWAVAIIVGLGLFAVWVAVAARLWLPVAGGRSPRWVAVTMLAASGLVLTVSMGVFFLVRSTWKAVEVSGTALATERAAVAAVVWPGPTPVYRFVRDAEIATFVHRPVVWVAIVLLWMFPVAALVVGARRGRRELQWATLGDPRVTLEQPHARVGRAAAIGLIGAAGVILAALVLRVALRHALSGATRSHDEFILGFYVWTVTLGLVGQGVAAAVAAATCRTSGIVLGLFAGALTSLGAAVSLFALPSFASCVDFVAIRPGGPCTWSVDGSFIRQSFEQLLVQGTLVALAGAGIGALAAALVHRRRAATPRAVVAS